jgi:hypothetical protein
MSPVLCWVPIRTPQLAALQEDLWDIADASQQDGDKAKGAELQGRAGRLHAAHFRAFAASRRSVKARSRWVCRSSVRSAPHRRMAIE